MTLPIQPGGPAHLAFERPEATLSVERPETSFSDLFTRAIQDTSGLERDAKDLIGAFLRGEPVELHQLMAASEEAAISLELLVEIRNKLTEAYRSVMNVQ